MATVECKVDIPAGPGLKNDQLTVGRIFFLNCQGEFSRDFKLENSKLVLDEAHKYALKILSAEFRSPTELDLKVTSYTATQVRFENLQISDGQSTLDLGAVQFQLASVLPAPQQGATTQKPPEQPKPYGPMGPAPILIPNLYWTILAGALGLLAVTLTLKLWRALQRRKLIERLKQHDSAQSPETEFFAQIRQLQKKNTVFFGGKAEPSHIPMAVEGLQKYFKTYLTRKFQVPALEWPSRLVLNDIKKYHPKIYSEFEKDIRSLLFEFNQAQKDLGKLSETDALKISEQSQSLVNKLERGVK